MYRALVFVAVVGASGFPGQPSPVAVQDEPKHVLRFQNESVRVFEIAIPAGESTLLHEHRYDNLAMALQSAQLTNESANGQSASLRVEPGAVVFSSASPPYAHRIVNAGSLGARLMAIELLTPEPRRSRGFSPAALGARPLLENNRVRVWRVTVEPGQSRSSVRTGSAALRIIQSGGEAIETIAGQPTTAARFGVGDLEWLPPGEKRVINNVGDSRIVFLEFELR